METGETARPIVSPRARGATVEAALRGAVEALEAEWHDEAVAACERALALDPGCAEAFFLLGLASFELDEPHQALKLLTKAHELDPEVREFADGLAAVLARIAKVSEALFYAKLATTLAPHGTVLGLLPSRLGTFFANLDRGTTHLYLARAGRKLAKGRVGEAAEDCRRQLELTPGDPATLRLLGAAARELGRLEQSIAAYHGALHAEPPRADRPLPADLPARSRSGFASAKAGAGFAKAGDLNGLARALAQSGRLDESGACHRAALDLAPDEAALHAHYLADLVDGGTASAADLAAAHLAWAARHCAAIRPHRLDLFQATCSQTPLTQLRVRRGQGRANPSQPSPPAGGGRGKGEGGASTQSENALEPEAADEERPLRVAHLCGAFYRNDFVALYEPVLKAHRPERVQVHCYYDGRRSDAATESLMRAAHKWTDVTGVDDETLWQILRGDEIDLAVDLSGHYPGGRLSAFARRLAPLSLSWLGYPYPPAVPELDYYLTDAAACPPGEADPPGAAKLWRLPRPALAYEPPTLLPEVGPLPAGRLGHVTLGLGCSLGLISPERARLWAALMARLPGARLLVCNRFDQDEACIERCLELFSHFGLRHRVDIVNMADNFDSEFDVYQHVDLALDPGAPEARVEACRALWMGVPVVALAGAHCAARQGASVLAAAGRAEWVAHDPARFVEVASGLAADLDRLAELRAGLRARVARSPLADVAGLARTLEDAFLDLWRERLQRARDH